MIYASHVEFELGE